MKFIQITYGTPTKLFITLTNLTLNQYAFSDISDALFMLKHNATDTDESALITKDFKTNNGVVLNLDTKTIEIEINKLDFGSNKLQIGVEYLMCLSVEFLGDGNYIEDFDPKLERKVSIMQDKTRR